MHALVPRNKEDRAISGEMMLLRERRAKGTWYVTVFPLRIDGETRFAGGSAREVLRHQLFQVAAVEDAGVFQARA